MMKVKKNDCYRVHEKDTLEFDCNEDDEIVVFGLVGEKVEPPIYPKTKIAKHAVLLFEFDDGVKVSCKYKESHPHDTAALVYHIFEADDPHSLRVLVDQAKEN
jgi:hypothetical protein